MAYQYKLVKELGPNTLSKIGKFVTDNPKVEYIRKEFVKVPANTDESEKLDFVLRGTLEKRGGFTPSDIEEYMDFLYTERNNNVGGEWGDTPLNEKEEGYAVEKVGKDEKTGKDILKIEPGSLQTALDNRLQKFKDEDDPEFKFDPEAKNTFKQAVKEMVMAKLKEGKPCWKGYEQIGMKEKNGKQVPNCVPKKR
jgi:hypothetical protein